MYLPSMVYSLPVRYQCSNNIRFCYVIKINLNHTLWHSWKHGFDISVCRKTVWFFYKRVETEISRKRGRTAHRMNQKEKWQFWLRHAANRKRRYKYETYLILHLEWAAKLLLWDLKSLSVIWIALFFVKLLRFYTS